jgi:hypothetical protein
MSPETPLKDATRRHFDGHSTMLRRYLDGIETSLWEKDADCSPFERRDGHRKAGVSGLIPGLHCQARSR